MGKYEILKYRSRVKARVCHHLQTCQVTIAKAESDHKGKTDFAKPSVLLCSENHVKGAVNTQ
jgi:hypothetical protein